MLLGLDTLNTDKLLSLVGDILSLLLICHDIECLTCSRSTIETEN